jgi:hypothetical protein
MEQYPACCYNFCHISKPRYKSLREVTGSKGLKPGLKLIVYNIDCQSCWLCQFNPVSAFFSDEIWLKTYRNYHRDGHPLQSRCLHNYRARSH